MLVRVRPSAVLCMVGVGLAACGCAPTPEGSGSSPQQAVATFLAPFPRKSLVGLSAAEQRRRALALWRTMCDRVDPAIRRGLRVPYYVTIPDRHTACGAVVVLMVLNTPENSDLVPPATVAGAPLAAATHGNTSIVTVDVRYRPLPGVVGASPPARATIKVLVVKRDGRWWVATPDAFNAEHARRGGLTESELRRSYAKLLAAAK
jgi:hypothetical protein